MKQLWHDYMNNSKRWENNSDEWVKTMTESKENKEKYQEYVSKTKEPLTYIEWLKKERKYLR